MENYNASSIEKEEGPERHRKRVARYLDSSDAFGIENMFFEVLDNAIDETVAYANLMNKEYNTNITLPINITINEDYSVTVEDFGRGMPCDINEKYNVPGVYLIMESDSAGGKNRGTEGYQGSKHAGVHGAGAAVSNSCSEYMEIEINSLSANGKYKLRYELGNRVIDLKRIGDLEPNKFWNGIKQGGTKVTYKHDENTFEMSLDGRVINFPYAINRIRNRLKYSLIGETANIEIRLKFRENDIEIITPDSFTPNKYLESDDITKISINLPEHDLDADIYLKLDTSYGCVFTSKTIINRLDTIVAKSNDSLKNAINSLALEAFKIISKSRDYNFDADEADFTKPVSALIIMGYADAEYSGQVKQRFISTKYQLDFEAAIKKALNEDGKYMPKLVEISINKLLLEEETNRIMEKRRIELEKKQEEEKKNSVRNEILKNIKDGKMISDDADPQNLLNVLASRYARDVSTAVLVEGNSAGTALESLQDNGGYPAYVITLKGKVTNGVESEIDDLILAMKAKVFDVNFKDFLILTDPDTDGRHIVILLLYLFYKYAKYYLDSGNVYILKPPFGEVIIDNDMELIIKGEGIKYYKKGKITTYSWSEHRELIKNGGRSLIKFKGLADTYVSIEEMVKDRSCWYQVKCPDKIDIELLEKVLTTGDSFKTSFTSMLFTNRLNMTKMFGSMNNVINITKDDINKSYTDVPELKGYEKYMDKYGEFKELL